MKILEKQMTDVVIGVKCDICNKESKTERIKFEDEKFCTIKFTGGGWQGCSGYIGERDVCSLKCLTEALKNLESNWENIISITNCLILQKTVNVKGD